MIFDNPNLPERDEQGHLEEAFLRKTLFSPEAEHWPTPWQVDGCLIRDASGELVCTAATPLLAELIEDVVFKFILDTKVGSWTAPERNL